MKKQVIFMFLLFFTGIISVYAQKDTITPAYQRYPGIPPFTLMALDSTTFTRDALTKNKPVLLMYFSPDCDHCQHQTKDMLADMEQLKQVQILMCSYQPLPQMQAFYKDYALSKYPNILMGRDISYFFPPFFQMKNLPFMALYNKKFVLIKIYEGNHRIEKLSGSFKNGE